MNQDRREPGRYARTENTPAANQPPHLDPDPERLLSWQTAGLARQYYEDYVREGSEPDSPAGPDWEQLPEKVKQDYFQFIANQSLLPVGFLEIYIDAMLSGLGPNPAEQQAG